jgi:hypothetical protein
MSTYPNLVKLTVLHYDHGNIYKPAPWEQEVININTIKRAWERELPVRLYEGGVVKSTRVLEVMFTGEKDARRYIGSFADMGIG